MALTKEFVVHIVENTDNEMRAFPQKKGVKNVQGKEMPYSINHIQSAAEIAWQGKFDYNESTSFKNIINEICQQDIKLLVLNLSDCDYIDSAGLGLLMMAREIAIANEIYLKIIGVHSQVLRMLEVAQFGEIIDFEHCTREGVVDLFEQIANG